MAKKARKKSSKKSAVKARKTTASKKRPLKKKAKGTAKRKKSRPAKGFTAKVSGAYHTVVDTITGTDRLRNKMSRTGASETE